ncbi:MAG: PPC domain-containing DNA-binding protein [Bacteroidia bacterium]
MITYALRLKNGEDLNESLDSFIKNKNCKAACILTCVGSLQRAAIRFANQSETKTLTGKFEIVSLVGTLSVHGSHIHIAVADENGNLIGGHLKEGGVVFTTAEIVLGVLEDVEFLRLHDEKTGYNELVIKPL